MKTIRNLFTAAAAVMLLAIYVLPAQEPEQAPEQPAQEESVEGPAIKFAVGEYDFGRVSERGRKVSYDYVFTNTGTSPLVVTRAVTSCKCVSTSFNRRPIPPGGQGAITITYDPKKQQGVFYKAIQVYTNTPEKMHIIIAKGEVVP